VTHNTPDSEDALEQAALALFQQMGWDTVNCMDEVWVQTSQVFTVQPVSPASEQIRSIDID
jgi:hypothetical protein